MLDEVFIRSYEEKILRENTLYQWSYTGSTLGKDELYIRWGGGALASSVYPLILFIVSGMSFSFVYFAFALPSFIVFLLMFRYLFLPDCHLSYCVKKSGIYITKKDKIPEVAYRIVRIIAWCGIVVCLFAGLMFGPMIFFGVGTFALLSFGLTRFSSEEEKSYVFIEPPTIIFNPKSELFVEIYSLSQKDPLYSRFLHFNDFFDKGLVIDNLCDSLCDVELYNVEKYNDIYGHPVFEKHRKEYEEEEMNEQ